MLLIRAHTLLINTQSAKGQLVHVFCKNNVQNVQDCTKRKGH